MAGWRDGVAEEDQEQLDSLLDLCLTAGIELLESNGEFFPIAFTVNEAGVYEAVSFYPGEDKVTAEVVEADLLDSIRSTSDGLVAFGIAVLVTFGNRGRTAIRVGLEHRGGTALAVYLPYRQNRQGKVRQGELKLAPNERLVWPDDKASGA